MDITIIAAVAQNRVIGKDNDLIWYIPDDLKHFKKLTAGHHIIMGRKTYESMMRPLPKRVNIVISRDPDYRAEGCLMATSLEEAIKMVDPSENEAFIIGGGSIYGLALNMATKMELTEVKTEVDGDTFFPDFDKSKWELISRANQENPDERNEFEVEYLSYIKK